MERTERGDQNQIAADLRAAAETILAIHHLKLSPKRPLVSRLGPFVIELTTPFNRPPARMVELPHRTGPRLRAIPAPIHPYELTIWLTNRVLCLGWPPDRRVVVMHFFRGEWEGLFFQMAATAVRRHARLTGRPAARPPVWPVSPRIWTP